MRHTPQSSGGGEPLHVPSDGPIANPGVRRILALAGFDLRTTPPRHGAAVAVWGNADAAPETPVVRIQNALLRGIEPRGNETPAGLIIAPAITGTSLSSTSRIEAILRGDPLDDAALLQHAHTGMARWKRVKLSKYNNFDPHASLPKAGYVLIADQPPGSAALRQSGASAATFRDMLNAAVDDFPHARIVIKLHPAAAGRHHFRDMDFGPRVTYLDAPVSPADLLEGASAVYTVSSQMGFEAILAGHRPKVFGRPFYAGWGLTDDAAPIPGRGRTLSRAQLFAAAMILAPTWYDPCRDRLCTFEESVDLLEARLRAWREDRGGYLALGMNRARKKTLQEFLGPQTPLRFARAADGPEPTTQPALVWGTDAGAVNDAALLRVANGFLPDRTRDSQPPVSLIFDDLGLYTDPTRESRLERLIAAPCPPDAEARAERLIRRLISGGTSNAGRSGASAVALPAGHRILVPGQVESAPDVRGTGGAQTNLDLLKACRAANPQAVLIYAPHPDAGRHTGALSRAQALAYADHIAGGNALALIERVNEVWTMTSTLGFQALLRGKPVTCLGQPFYSGWGLTRDIMPAPPRRTARPTLARLVHAALIAYPRYRDPVSGLDCPVEVVVERLNAEAPARNPLRQALERLRFWPH